MKQREPIRSAVLLLGPPGSGKTTLAHAVAAQEDSATIEAGALLKKRIREDEEMACKLRPHLEAGEMVPANLVKQVIADRLSKLSDGDVLFDGFPRTGEQITPFLNLLQANALELRSVVVPSLSLEESIQRLTARRVCPECGEVFNTISDPPEQSDVCDRCGSTLIRRKDDEPAIIRRRYGIYEQETGPVIEFFTRNHPELTHTQSAALPASKAAERIRMQLTTP